MRDDDYAFLRDEVIKLLGYNRYEADKFMRSEQKHLDGRRPVDCRFEEVHRLILKADGR